MNSYPLIVETPQISVLESAYPTLVENVDARRRFSKVPENIPGWSLSKGKRAFDVLLSIVILVGGGIPMLLIAICIRFTSRGPAIFVQQRVGQDGRLFRIYKFRSMTVRKGRGGIGLTKGGDVRVTPFGRLLRALKLDELPQFYNILRGDMSVVGPRPKLPEYADDLNLAYRPGITGAASLAFRREEEILACVPASQLETFYHDRIKPMKASIDSRYMMHATLGSDIRIILWTVFSGVAPSYYSALQHHELEQISELEPAEQMVVGA